MPRVARVIKLLGWGFIYRKWKFLRGFFCEVNDFVSIFAWGMWNSDFKSNLICCIYIVISR